MSSEESLVLYSEKYNTSCNENSKQYSMTKIWSVFNNQRRERKRRRRRRKKKRLMAIILLKVSKRNIFVSINNLFVISEEMTDDDKYNG